MGQAAGGELDLMVLIGSPLFRYTNQHHQIQFTTYCLPYIRLPKIPNHYIFTLTMSTAVFAESLDKFQHSMRIIHETELCIEVGIVGGRVTDQTSDPGAPVSDSGQSMPRLSRSI
jgi:hypothetical protein